MVFATFIFDSIYSS